MEWAAKTGTIQIQKKGLHIIKDGKTLWLIWNLTDSVTVPRPIQDDQWKYHIELSPDLSPEVKKQLENILKADGKK